MSWYLDRHDIAPIARGCGLLGSGGGGDTHIAVLLLRALVDKGSKIKIIDADELDAEGLILTAGYVGAPLVLSEKLFAGDEMVAAIEALRRRLGAPVQALIAAEIGGMNGMTPLIASALTGIAVVDADGMGRAFPRNDQLSFAFNGLSGCPSALASEAGDVLLIERASNARAEDIARAVATVMGGKAFAVDYPLSADQVQAYAIPATLSLARTIGKVLSANESPEARLENLAATLQDERGLAVCELFAGRVTSIDRETSGGFDRGTVEIAARAAGRTVKIDFQNEFLTLFEDGSLVASTPDIISLVDPDTLLPIPSETVRYGQNVRVIGISAPAALRTPAALAAVGPFAFGYDWSYRPLGRLGQ